MDITVIRNYSGASFLFNRKTQRSVFFEGPLAILAPHFLRDPDYIVSDDFLAKFRPEDKNEILADCTSVKEAVISLSDEKAEMSSSEHSSLVNNALKELSAYAIRNWQVVNVNLELTYLCNQRCRCCYLDDFHQKGMSRSWITNLAQELKQVGALFILLTGGEIFLRSDTIDIMEDLEKVGFILEIKTNGTCLRPDVIERMAQLHLFDIQVSIYEVRSGYSDLTRSIYRFDELEKNVRLMLGNGLPVTLSVLVGRHNINEIEKIHEMLNKTGAEIFYSPYLTPNRHSVGQEISFRLSKKEMEEKFKPFLEKIDAFPIQNKYRNCDTDSTVCYAGRDQIAIDPTGRVYPCLDLRLQLGDLTHESLKEILTRRQGILERFTLNEMPKCRLCVNRDYCDSCVGLALIENNDYRTPSQHKCDIIGFYAQKRR